MEEYEGYLFTLLIGLVIKLKNFCDLDYKVSNKSVENKNYEDHCCCKQKRFRIILFYNSLDQIRYS